MARRVLPVWSGERLVHVGPMAVIRALGYEPTYRSLPESDAYRERMYGRACLQDGPIAADRRTIAPVAARQQVDEWCRELGVDDAGVTAVDPAYVYEGADLTHRHAIVLAMTMDYRPIASAPSAETNAEVMRVYAALADVTIELAARIRALGYPARAHTLAQEGIAFIPHAVAAGLGELGKHGSLLSPTLGASFRLAAVTTDLPLVENTPTTERVADLCRNCSLCVDHCPGGEISHERDTVRGTERWIVDTELCAPIWAAHHACAICLQVCPWNARTGTGPVRELYVRTVRGVDRAERTRRLAEEAPARVRPADPAVAGSNGARARELA